MLEHDRIDILEGIDINKANASNSVIFVIIGILKSDSHLPKKFLLLASMIALQK